MLMSTRGGIAKLEIASAARRIDSSKVAHLAQYVMEIGKG